MMAELNEEKGNRFRVESVNQISLNGAGGDPSGGDDNFSENGSIDDSISYKNYLAYELNRSSNPGGGGGGDRRRPSVTISVPENEKPSPSSRRLSRKRSSFQFTTQRSLRHYLTREAIPHADHYRNKMSFAKGKPDSSRPTLDDLLNDDPYSKDNSDLESQTDDQDTGSVIKFGWIEGVYMRCLLNIWGVMLFLRLTWVIGQAGLLEGLAIITLSNIVTVITSISMSAVSTNGQIKAGGIYFMISRSLGPEFGGAIGLMFTLANSIAVAMYIIGFCEALSDMLKQYIPGFIGILNTPEDGLHDIRLIGSVSLVLLLGLAIVGMEWVTRVQKGLLVLLLFSQLDFIIGSFLPPSEDKLAKGFVGYNGTVLMENLFSDYIPNEGTEKNNSFFTVFAVFFPAVTGIVAGANLSGDLKDPGVAIPKGTLLAIVSTYVTYTIYGVMIAACTLREASGDVLELDYVNETIKEVNNITNSFWECENRTCSYGILHSQQMMEVISAWGPLIYAGCFAATLSSAIASLVGAPRVFQAVAKDKLFPGIASFADGWGKNNDPVKGYLLVFLISLICILIGDLNYVSSLLSNFFVAAYALINFSVFHASITKSPGWRPGFKYYNKWISLLGTVLCICVMFLMDMVTALVTFIIVFFLYMYVSIRKPEVNWGSSTQAQSFMTALNSVLSLTKVEDHVKNYRPKIMVMSGSPLNRPTLIDFANLVTKRISLLESVDVVPEDLDWKKSQAIKNSGQNWFTENHIKGFFSVVRNSKISEGARTAMELSGLGKLRTNMILLGFQDTWWKKDESAKEYYKIIQTAFDLRLAVGVLRINGGLDVTSMTNLMEDSSPNQSNALNYDDRCESNMSVDSGLDLATKSGAKNTSTQSGEDDKEDGSLKRNKKPNGFEKLLFKKKCPSSIPLPPSEKDVKPLDEDIVNRLSQFRDKTTVNTGTIDVYWLYDDGGLTILIPHILQTRAKYSKCKMRVFFLSNKNDELDGQTRSMASLLAKFRIDFQDVIMLTDATKQPKKETKDEFKAMLANNSLKNSNSGKKHSTSSRDSSSSECDEVPPLVSELDIIANKEKTNFNLRIAEIVKDNSSSADLIVMTLPMPKKEIVPQELYMAWLDYTTKDMPPFLLVRGNQTSVLTFYS
ncbi:bumetanide-sensitive sodium-(potassium)-chloride cotransporter [Lepeophtheirus salmonis]|nr:solute carrier family 12 member 3-like [Lepeophtheirus salmonis]